MTRAEAIEWLEIAIPVRELSTKDYKRFMKAITMAIDSLETDEAYQLEYERTTKNDLGVDCISRADVNRLICEYGDDATETGNERDLERAYGANAVGELISELPSVYPKSDKSVFEDSERQKIFAYLDGCCDGMKDTVPLSVLEDIKAQIPNLVRYESADGQDLIMAYDMARLIDEYISGEEQTGENT